MTEQFDFVVDNSQVALVYLIEFGEQLCFLLGYFATHQLEELSDRAAVL